MRKTSEKKWCTPLYRSTRPLPASTKGMGVHSYKFNAESMKIFLFCYRIFHTPEEARRIMPLGAVDCGCCAGAACCEFFLFNFSFFFLQKIPCMYVPDVPGGRLFFGWLCCITHRLTQHVCSSSTWIVVVQAHQMC